MTRPIPPAPLTSLFVAPTASVGAALAVQLAAAAALALAGTYAAGRRQSPRLAVLMFTAAVLMALQAVPLGGGTAGQVQRALIGAHVPVLFHATLVAPLGRLAGRLDYGAVSGAYVGWVALLGLSPGRRAGEELLLLVMVGCLALAYDRASAASRWTTGPLWIGTAGTLVLLLTRAMARPALGPLDWLLYVGAVSALPIAFVLLVAQAQRARRQAVEEIRRYQESPSPWVLRDLVHDPTLQVLAAAPADAPSDRIVTALFSNGSAVGALIHDPAVLQVPQLLAAATSAATPAAAYRQRLSAARSELAAVSAGRQQLAIAVAAERARIERNLHDGAQQRLVTTALRLRRAATQDLPPDTTRLVTETADEIELAAAEIRSLARGLYPSLLTDRGLIDALHALAAASTTVPIILIAPPHVTLPEDVAAGAYFAAAEVVTNALKHASASNIAITVSVGADLAIEVRDDGAGGAKLRPAGGLAGVHARLAALGGSMRIDSPPGRGSAVLLVLPRAAAL